MLNDNLIKFKKIKKFVNQPSPPNVQMNSRLNLIYNLAEIAITLALIFGVVTCCYSALFTPFLAATCIFAAAGIFLACYGKFISKNSPAKRNNNKTFDVDVIVINNF